MYLDAIIPQEGKSLLDTLPPEVAEGARKSAQQTSGWISLPPPPMQNVQKNMGLTDQADLDWVERHFKPQPMITFETALKLKNPVGNNLPKTYIACTNPVFPGVNPSKTWVKQQQGWDWLEIPTGHMAMLTAPDELTKLLEQIASA